MKEAAERRGRQTYDNGSGGVNETEGVGRDNQGIMSFSENEM